MLVWALMPGHTGLDRAVNFLLIALAAVSVYRLTRVSWDDLLWRVSRKLLLSYVLVGAVPILLLATFSALAFLLLFFSVGSYLVQERLAQLSDRAAVLGRAALFDVARAGPGGWDDVARRRQADIQTRHTGATLSVKPAAAIPGWVPRSGFTGLVADGRTARAVVFPGNAQPAYAIVVDLPVSNALRTLELAPMGLAAGDQKTALFNTATFVSHVDWETGEQRRTALAVAVDIPVLYDWLGRSHGGAAAGFNRVLSIMLFGIGILLFVIEVVALGNGVALARTITTSVDELFAGTERVKSGDFAGTIPVRSDDQLGRLAASFNDMTGRIGSLLAEQDEKRRLEQELRIARDIQMSLLPQTVLTAPGLSIAALCAPAREVGGDYYDFLPLPDGRVAILVADVAGKGASAALYMAELKGLMLSLSRIHSSPRALLIEANQIISHHLDSRSFITMTYAVIDAAAGTLTCARAGHTPFVRVTACDGVPRAELLAPEGMVLGLNLDGGVKFERCLEETVLPMQAGDLFLFYTDGVSEAMDGDGACFGEGRLAALVERHAADSAEIIRDRLIAEVADFVQGEPQHDDITMVIVKVGDHG